jgi:UDP-3-O-[3-hydroxymyristoyl] glucosamine N-acyltransferase
MALRTVAPSDLATTASRSPRRLRLEPERISAYASRLDLRQTGPDFEIDSFRPFSALDEPGREDSHPLTYLSSKRFAPSLEGRTGLTVVTTPALEACVPPENGVLLTSEPPRDIFHSIMSIALDMGLFECLETFISATARISPTAVISPNVYVSDSAEIGAGVVILANTYVGPGVVIKPNAVIGGNGFEPVSGRLARRVVTHAGGVWLAEGVHVGSCNCVDKGLFGDFTELGSYTLLDNLVQFAHSSRAGRCCSLTACAEISGSVVLGDGVWLGPNSSISQGIRIADHCYIGTGSVVVRDLKPYSLAYGSPAKFAAWVCECRAKLRFEAASSTENNRSTCEACGKQFLLTNGTVRPA